MITMKPILAEEVLEIFNKGRFKGEVEGYIISDGTGCLGHCLYRVDGETAVILQAQTKDASLLDGVIRSCLSVAQENGATGFWVEDTSPELTQWRTLWCKDRPAPIPFDVVFHTCCS